jgi:3-dehydroquinate synthase
VRKLQITTRFGEYTVSVGSGILSSLTRRTAALATNPRQLVFLLTSPEIWSLWGERVETALSPRTPVVLFLAPGERHKRMAQVERLATEMAKAGADRSSILIAFGGGVIGDMGGFLAAIYMRGIDYIQVPTTLLAQVDSSVGGKVAANLQTGKNLVGCFYPPQAVIADISLLHTLPHRELRAGIYESIKAGLIRDAALFRYIESHREEIDGGEPAALEKMVAASIQVKAEVVALDERELGLRMILNFGHTIGHAIEAATGYRALLHGEAIAWGMLIALEVSRARNLVKADAVRRVQSLLHFFAPPAFPAVRTRRLLQAASGDKKNRAGVRRFVLLAGIGNAVVVEDVTDTELMAAIDAVRTQ